AARVVAPRDPDELAPLLLAARRADAVGLELGHEGHVAARGERPRRRPRRTHPRAAGGQRAGRGAAPGGRAGTRSGRSPAPTRPPRAGAPGTARTIGPACPPPREGRPAGRAWSAADRCGAVL